MMSAAREYRSADSGNSTVVHSWPFHVKELFARNWLSGSRVTNAPAMGT